MELTLPPGEPAAGAWTTMGAAALLHRLVRSRAGDGPRTPPLVVAVDGRGGAGKSTLSELLASAAMSSVVVHTDDIAWNEPLFEWGRSYVSELLEPLRRDGHVDFRPPAWEAHDRPGSITVPHNVALVIVEGVGAAQRATAGCLDAVVWVQSDFAEAERRGIARDIASGENGDAADATAFWHEWMAAELAFQARERPWERADVIVCGTTAGPDSERILVADGPLSRNAR